MIGTEETRFAIGDESVFDEEAARLILSGDHAAGDERARQIGEARRRDRAMIENMQKRCGELLQELDRAQKMMQMHQQAGEAIVRNILRLEGALTLMKEMGVTPPAGLQRVEVESADTKKEARIVDEANRMAVTTAPLMPVEP